MKVFQTPRQTSSEELQVIKHKLQHLFQTDRSDDNFGWCCQKIYPLKKKWTKWALNEKSMLYSFSPLHWLFCYSRSHTCHIKLWDLFFYHNYHKAKAPSIPKHIFKVRKPNCKLILYYGKVVETFLTSVKNAKIMSFLRTKSCLTEKLSFQTSIFLIFWKLYILALIGYQS